MKVYLYFPLANLVIQVEYREKQNVLLYQTNRKITPAERYLLERRILDIVAVKTGFYLSAPATFSYLGVCKYLAEAMQILETRTLENERQIEASVKDVIRESMRSYYSGKIVSALCERIDGAPNTERLTALVEAYNANADRKICAETLLKEYSRNQ